MMHNLFSSLSQYASRQEENFLTESLVIVLNILLEKEGQKTAALLQNICGPDTIDWFQDIPDIDISTQFSVEEGRPDIIIKVGNGRVVFIEVKHDSSLGWMQLERYFKHLEKSDYQAKQLVLLTRSKHSIQETTLEQDCFHHICWYQIAGWLSEAEWENEISQYLVDQFLDFLKQKDMSMEKVTWEYIKGMPAMTNLLSMLGTAVAEYDPELNVKKTMGWSWGGYYIDGGIFLGFRFINHLVISFENNVGTNPSFKRDLDLENIHFFSLSAGEQLESLIKFIKDCYKEYSNLGQG